VRFVSVAVPIPYLDALTYQVPDDLPASPPVGARVRVPVGGRTLVGCVVANEPEGSAPADVRKILGVLDEEPHLPEGVVRLCRWVAEYYMAGIGDTIWSAMPPGAQRGSAFRLRRVAGLTTEGRQVASGGADQRAGGSRPLTSRQMAVLQRLAGASADLPLTALRDLASAEGVRRLATRGLLYVRDDRHERDPFDRAAIPTPPTPGDRELTDEQASALETLRALGHTGRFHAALLHGVTGSGKTEIYLRLAAHTRDAGRQTLLLVPEIALTPSVSALFRAAFGSRVAIQHSGLSVGERHDQWHRIREGEVDVVIGTRSAVFAPLTRVGLIIVDEEHDTSYKQEEAPRYHGRDVAVIRGQSENALVVLGSATPSMESYHNAVSGKYALVTMRERVLARPLAAVQLVNMRDEYAAEGPDVVLSRALVEAIEARLTRREQVVVLLNRRGYSTAVLCRQCGDCFDCPNCSISLTVHRVRSRWRAVCHYCNYGVDVPTACRKCAAPYLERTGFGTARVEQCLRDRFPDARVGRIDRDAVRSRDGLTTQLSQFAVGNIDILVGTQMVAKGHDFPRVTLVGVVSADVGLGVADFRASERTFQLLTQVAGRAGRGEQAGEAIIQTLYPDHYSIELARQQNYAGFFARELDYRTQMRYPPMVALVNTIARGRTLGEAFGTASAMVERLAPLARQAQAAILGPAPAPIERLRGEHRVQFFLKGTRRSAMREAIRTVLAAMPEVRRRVTVDVDPLTLL
jgi:primosomal protein N' (replication factor Y)